MTAREGPPQLCRPPRRLSVRVKSAQPARAPAVASITASAGLVTAYPAAASPRSTPTANMAPDLAGAAERGGTEPAHAVAIPYPEFLSRATHQGAEALAAGRIGDAIKLFTEALELAGACAGATPLVVSEVLARRSAAQLAAGDPERALEDSLAAVQQSATREVRAH